MTTLVEDPTWIIVLGIVVEAMLAVLLVNLRQGWIAWVMLGVFVLVLAGVGLEWLIVTDRERVEATLCGAAEAVEANDLDRLLMDYIDPHANLARQLATDALKSLEVTSAKISGLRVKINELTSPPTAEAKFIGSVRFEDPRGRIPYRSRAANCTILLRLENDRWLVTDPVQFQDIN